MSKQPGVGSPENKQTPQIVPFPTPEHPARETAPSRRTMARWLIWAGAAVVLIAGAVGVWWSMGSGTAVRYVTTPATIGPIARSVSATGTVNPELTIIVGTYVSGVIQELTCDYNTQVKRGQSCAKIDPRPYQSIVDQGKANLAVAKAQLEKDKASLTYAKANLGRLATLVQSNAVSKDAYDNAKSVYEQALAQITFDEATIQQRQAVLDAAQVNLDYTDIISPVDGTVVSRNVTMGQTVAASFQTPTLFLIATDLTKMQVDANVSESDIGGIENGNKATFTVDAYAKRVFEGTVTQVRQSPQTVQNVVTYDVVVSVDNSDLALKPGLTAATRIIVDQRSAVLRVPNPALRYVPTGTDVGDAKQPRIWVFRDGAPAPVQVTTGLDDDDFTEIVRGELKPNDRVIIGEQQNSVKSRSGVPAPRL
jgi:HlyD family secretion protein